MNPFKRMKLKTKLRNCDYKLAGTVIKQQYYNENSYTEVNRMIDHFMEEPCFERALDLIDYNEMIVFYFTESCTDGLYVRKAPIEPAKSNVQLDSNTSEEVHTFAEPPSTEKSIDSTNKAPSAHSEHLQKIQESEEWMDQMINRLAKKPKLPTVNSSTSTPPPAPTKVYMEDEVEAFDTIEFITPDSFNGIEVPPEVKIVPNIEKKEIIVFRETEEVHEPEPIKEIEVFYETEMASEPEPIKEIEDTLASQEAESMTAFNFVASAESDQQLEMTKPAELFTDSPSPIPERPRTKRPSFPNVVATLKIDMHTMVKQLDEYRYQLAYHPHNEQQMIGWIDALERAIDEFSAAIDLIEDS